MNPLLFQKKKQSKVAENRERLWKNESGHCYTIKDSERRQLTLFKVNGERKVVSFTYLLAYAFELLLCFTLLLL